MTKNKSHFFKLVRDHTLTKESFTRLYAKRAEILWPFIKVKENIGDCEMNVTSLFEKMTKSFSDTLGLVSCNVCGSSRTLHYQTKILQGFDIIDCCDIWTNLLTTALSQDNINCRKRNDLKEYVSRIPVENLQIYIALIVYIECT